MRKYRQAGDYMNNNDILNNYNIFTIPIIPNKPLIIQATIFIKKGELFINITPITNNNIDSSKSTTENFCNFCIYFYLLKKYITIKIIHFI